eukprot:gene9912-11738_t
MTTHNTLEQHALSISTKASWIIRQAAGRTLAEEKAEGLYELFLGEQDTRTTAGLYDRLDAPLDRRIPTATSCAQFWSTKSLLDQAAQTQNVIQPDPSTAKYYSNLADMRELSLITSEELRRLCIPLHFPDEFRVRKHYLSSQVAAMCLLISTCDLNVQARSEKLVKMYNGRITVQRDAATGMRFRVLSVPPGLGKTAMVLGAMTALMRNGTFRRIVETADAWCKQVRSNSGVGTYFTDSAVPVPRAVVFFVVPDNVWAYWHGNALSQIGELSEEGSRVTLYPPTSTEKFYWSRALQAIEAAGVGETHKAIVMLSPTNFSHFLKEGHNLAWPLTVFDEFSAHCSKFGNCAIPLCREFWAVTATPTEICKAITGNLKTNPFRALLGDKFSRCEIRPHQMRDSDHYTTATHRSEMLCGNAQVLLLTVVPKAIIGWINDEVATLMYSGVALITRGNYNLGFYSRDRLLDSHQPREVLSHFVDVHVWDLSVDEQVATNRKLLVAGDVDMVTHFRKVEQSVLPDRLRDVSSKAFANIYSQADLVTNKRRFLAEAPETPSTHIASWWNGETANKLIDLPTVLRMLDDACRTADADLRRVLTRSHGHEDSKRAAWMTHVRESLKCKAVYLHDMARWLEASEDVPTLPPPSKRANFALRFQPFVRPFNLSKVLVCMNCSTFLTLDDVISSGWYLDNVEWTLNEDVNLCNIEYIRCPECYIKATLDEGVRPMCEVPFGLHLSALPSTDLFEMRRAGFELKRCLRGERMYDHVTDDFYYMGAAAMLDAVIREAVLVRGMRRLVFFSDPGVFDAVCVPMLQALQDWSFMEGAPRSVAYRKLTDGRRPGVSTCHIKTTNLEWYNDEAVSRGLRAGKIANSRDRYLMLYRA